MKFHSPPLYCCGRRNNKDRYLKTWTKKSKLVARLDTTKGK